ncbi:ribokinase [Spiroplasma sp. SV19]|uniref:ribokinase n=1 Tax=Spiroplasma sp. SV19 TaxID=2570468 RepID=UPI0024B68A61|nr:ribokinase [Spiroplasma sp. SV19]WHQ36338.1 ribokinase [Spiroplasma sp. SV19]
MQKILVVGSINMDLSFECKRLPNLGETIISNNYKKYCGGKGANQAVALARLESDVTMIGVVGDDNYGHELCSNLKFNQVKTTGIRFSKEVSSGLASIIVDETGNNQIVVYPGANYELLVPDIDKLEALIVETDYVVCQLEIPIVTVEYVLQKAKQLGKTTILNCAPARELTKKILEYCDFLIPNETELQVITNTHYPLINETELITATQKLSKQGVKNIIVTLGAKGVLYANAEQTQFLKAFSVKAIDSTAAGDSFIGGFVTSLANGKTIVDSLEFANKVAAITVTRRGAQISLPYLYEVENYRFSS